MFDLLASADLLVPDAPRVVADYVARLGILPARGPWRQTWPDWGFDAHWCRVRRDLAQAPTQLEIIAPLPGADPSIGHPRIAEIAAQQGGRLHKTHSVPIACADLDVLVGRLAAAGAPYRLDPPQGALPFRRLWLGREAGRAGRYDPSADGGLYLEFISSADLGIPILARPPEPQVPETNLIRILARTVLVDDLDEVLSTLEENLGWAPDTATFVRDGARRARFGFTHIRSAVLELLQPFEPGTPEAGYHRRWGRGPHGIRIAVADLHRAKAHLVEAGTAHADLERAGGRSLLLDPAAMSGPQIELVQDGDER